MKTETKIRATKVAVTVLKVIGGAGLLTMTLCAPNAIQALGALDTRYRRGAHVNAVLARLIKHKFVRVEEKRSGSGKCITLTEKGARYLSDYEEGRKVLQKPKQWDRKYRILIFDIWEKRRHVRDELREFLRRLGFERLQDSVWVYPYECEEVAALLKSRFRVGNGLLYIVAESVENDRWLRERFGL